jgi:hypothetical protein
MLSSDSVATYAQAEPERRPQRPRMVESAWGALSGLLPVGLPRPLAEAAVPVSRQRAHHGFCR